MLCEKPPSRRHSRAVPSRALNVFINCPFDDDYKPCFEALIFTVTASGYRARCALEENDAGDIRFDKLCRLVGDSDKSVHDLSRVQLGVTGLPRFNMPFEYGLFQGAKRFGGKRQKGKTALAMVEKMHSLPVYMSDVAGTDPECHEGKPSEVIRAVRRYLHRRPDETPLPGAGFMSDEFDRFKSSVPRIAAALKIAPDELDPIRDYRDYIAVLTEFLAQS